MDAWLTVKDLRICHHSRELVKGISFQAQRGEVLGILGESGSGKSLTCMALTGVLPPGLAASGSVSVDNTSVFEQPSTLRGRKIAMILQNPMSCFDPVFSLRHHFHETLKTHHRPCNNVILQAALEEVGLGDEEHLLDLFPFQLSGGMLQRVMIALSLLLEAPYLIADEPTTDLDVISQARILTLLEKLRVKRGLSMVLVTHDLGVLARMADRVLVMHNGLIVENAFIGDIFDRRTSAYTTALVEAHLKLSGVTEVIS